MPANDRWWTVDLVGAEEIMSLPHQDKACDLGADLIARITEGGPLGVDDFMAICLGGADGGYYASKDPFGIAGDFVTAPEISGLFGEMCGLFLAHMFELSGQPENAVIVEAGPGRGTLMRDMRQVWQHLMPSLATAPLHLVETSPLLRSLQAATLADTDAGADADAQLHIQSRPPVWHDDVTSLRATIDTPLFGIANEFFDALPVAQIQFTKGKWHRRTVTVTKGRLDFGVGDPVHPLPDAAFDAPHDGMIAEFCPAAEDVMLQLARHIAQYGGAFLIIDYGLSGNPGDSLQAVAEHKPVDVFHAPGKADLSHWVDFAALGRAAQAGGARMIGPVPQGRFLMQIGLAMRAEAAGTKADPEMRRALLAAIDRLTSPAQMGEVFKVALLVPNGEGVPPGFEATPLAKTLKPDGSSP